MSSQDRRWLAGYALAARQLSELRRRSGWATGKGNVKLLIRIWRQGGRDERPHGRGYVDAHLDSVGC